MKYMSMFESLTGAKLKDCIVNDSIIFVVNQNEMGKAIGKRGANARRMENLLKKRIKIIEFSDNVSKFVGNLIYPAKAKEIRDNLGIIEITADDLKTKGILIGRDRHKINSINDIVKRYFEIKEVKVI